MCFVVLPEKKTCETLDIGLVLTFLNRELHFSTKHRSYISYVCSEEEEKYI